MQVFIGARGPVKASVLRPADAPVKSFADMEALFWHMHISHFTFHIHAFTNEEP